MQRTRSLTLALVLAAAHRVAAQVPVGDELQLAAETRPQQFRSVSIAAYSGGSFVAAWGAGHEVDVVGTAYSGYLFARRFDATRGSLGDAFQAGYPIWQPSGVATDSAGNASFVWQGFAGGERIYARLYDAQDGARGAELQVSSRTGDSPVVVRSGVGTVVTWQAADATGHPAGVHARVLDNSGQAATDEFRVDGADAQYVLRGGVGSDSVGNFVVVWTKQAVQNVGNSNIAAQRFGPTGSRTGEEIQVNPPGTSRFGAGVARAQGGEFAVVMGTGNADDGFFPARVFDAAGQPLSPELRATGSERWPLLGGAHVAFVDPSRFVVVWSGNPQDRTQSDIYGQVFDLFGQPQGAVFRVTSSTPYNKGYPLVSGDGQGSFVVAWLSLGADPNTLTLFARRFRLAAAGTCSSSATALCLQRNRFLVEASWQTADGSGTGQAIPLTSDTGGFWFFSSSNVELLVKVLDGCGLTGSYWVFAGGLTNVGVTLGVTDMVTGQTRTYRSTAGTAFQPILDTGGVGRVREEGGGVHVARHLADVAAEGVGDGYSFQWVYGPAGPPDTINNVRAVRAARSRAAG
ncbi:MAG TPA: hypothetical protein VHQ90_01060 [Thermoanaerobaculia bacterium]|nr:hypothetical protein [Thermoanaerobaculia bacterium]